LGAPRAFFASAPFSVFSFLGVLYFNAKIFEKRPRLVRFLETSSTVVKRAVSYVAQFRFAPFLPKAERPTRPPRRDVRRSLIKKKRRARRRFRRYRFADNLPRRLNFAFPSSSNFDALSLGEVDAASRIRLGGRSRFRRVW
jgi:hypothetical protein